MPTTVPTTAPNPTVSVTFAHDADAQRFVNLRAAKQRGQTLPPTDDRWFAAAMASICQRAGLTGTVTQHRLEVRFEDPVAAERFARVSAAVGAGRQVAESDRTWLERTMLDAARRAGLPVGDGAVCEVAAPRPTPTTALVQRAGSSSTVGAAAGAIARRPQQRPTVFDRPAASVPASVATELLILKTSLHCLELRVNDLAAATETELDMSFIRDDAGRVVGAKGRRRIKEVV